MYARWSILIVPGSAAFYRPGAGSELDLRPDQYHLTFHLSELGATNVSKRFVVLITTYPFGLS